MPEAGFLPIPKKLARAGVKDMVRISDARMSGTAFGTIVLHVAPEAAVGGPLALVRERRPRSGSASRERRSTCWCRKTSWPAPGGVAAARPAGPRLRPALRRAGAAGARGLRLRLPPAGPLGPLRLGLVPARLLPLLGR